MDNPTDIGAAPGMAPYIQIGRSALERAGRERMGTGAMQLSEAAGSGYAEKLREMKRNELAQQYGAGLESAYGMRNAEVQGSLLPLGQMELSRKMGQLGNTSQMAGLWIQKPRKNFWDYLKEGSEIGGNIAGMFAGGA